MQLDGCVQAVQDILRRCYRVRAAPAEVYAFVAGRSDDSDPAELADQFVAQREQAKTRNPNQGENS